MLVAIEVIGTFLVFVLFVITGAATWVGLLALLEYRIEKCPRCGHLTATADGSVHALGCPLSTRHHIRHWIHIGLSGARLRHH